MRLSVSPIADCAETYSSRLKLLEWDSAHFGLRIGRVLSGPIERHLMEAARAWARASSLDCMYLLAASDDPAGVRLASMMGWRMVDMRVTLGAPLLNGSPIETYVRQASPEDVPYLEQLAMRSHGDSRFYADGNFAKDACDRLFSRWIERSVLDPEFAGAVFVPESEGKPAGYITCSVKDRRGEIGLIAVDESARRMGLGRQLLNASAKWCAENGADHMSVVTQGCNIPALRMYTRSGYSIESIELWFHWWRGD